MKECFPKLLLTCFLALILPSSSLGKEIVIVYTNNTYGFLQPCTCPGAPFGGLNRRQTVLKAIKSRTKDFLLVDAGDLFSHSNEVEKNELVLSIYNYMKYDAINLGLNEVQTGINYLRTKSHFPFVASNITPVHDKKAPYTDSFIIEKKGVKVGILGIITRGIQESK